MKQGKILAQDVVTNFKHNTNLKYKKTMSNKKKQITKEVTVPLLLPLEFGDKQINSIVIKRAKYKHLMGVDIENSDELMNVFVRKRSDLPDNLVDELDFVDVANIIEEVSKAGFLG